MSDHHQFNPTSKGLCLECGKSADVHVVERNYVLDLENKLERIENICGTTDFFDSPLSVAILKVIKDD